MKKYILVITVTTLLYACNNEGEKTDHEKAADTLNTVDKAQHKMNEIIDAAQRKGSVLTDTITNKIIEPVKKEASQTRERIKEKVKEASEAMKE